LIGLKDKNGQVKTGWDTVDKRLFGGFNRGELNIFAGGSGAGKSLFLANLGVNFALNGMNVVYLTLELSEPLVSMRIDSMTTGVSTRDIFKDLDNIEMKVKMIGKKSGAMQIKYMPSGKTVNDIRSYMKEYEIKMGRKIDILLVDYLDLLMPISKKISAENLFIKDKFVSEELRNLAMEKNCVCVTAAQLNRGAVEEVEFDHSHISGGLSKIQTADNVFGIFTSRAMRERGKYQIQLMKTRSSSGVGMKIDLDFEIDTLRITDPGEDAQGESEYRPKSSAILDTLKRNSAPATADPETGEVDPQAGAPLPKIRAQTDSTKLRQFLTNMGTENDNLL
jgi:archaellum biogenesis ATPase FlaH